MSEQQGHYIVGDAPIELAELIGQDNRDLIVTAVQALHRERVRAWNTAREHAELAGGTPPSQDVFGLPEVNSMLRRLGAAPRCA